MCDNEERESHKQYIYKLTYIDGDTERTHTFSGWVGGDEMRDNLRCFLRACEWSEKAINKILGEGFSNVE